MLLVYTTFFVAFLDAIIISSLLYHYIGGHYTPIQNGICYIERGEETTTGQLETRKLLVYLMWIWSLIQKTYISRLDSSTNYL